MVPAAPICSVAACAGRVSIAPTIAAAADPILCNRSSSLAFFYRQLELFEDTESAN
jgi:hypothetical protein